MKTLLLIIICICCLCIGAYCQTFSEWFFQRKTRTKRLQQQIVALELLRATVQNGNLLAEKGVDTVRSFEQDNFLMDEDFLAHLRTVKPTFIDAPEVIACYALATVLTMRIEGWIELYSHNHWSRLKELNLIGEQILALTRDVISDIQQLTQLISDQRLEMEDGDRWEAIRQVEVDIRGAFENFRKYTWEVWRLVHLRQQQDANDAYLKSILQ
jgi:hypothetical protein